MNPNPITIPIESDVCQQCHQTARPGERALLSPEGRWIHDPQHNPCTAHTPACGARGAQDSVNGLAEVMLDLHQRLERLEGVGSLKPPLSTFTVDGGGFKLPTPLSTFTVEPSVRSCLCAAQRINDAHNTPADALALLVVMVVRRPEICEVLRRAGADLEKVIRACEEISGRVYDLGVAARKGDA